jgi:hypothetical protein
MTLALHVIICCDVGFCPIFGGFLAVAMKAKSKMMDRCSDFKPHDSSSITKLEEDCQHTQIISSALALLLSVSVESFTACAKRLLKL